MSFILMQGIPDVTCTVNANNPRRAVLVQGGTEIGEAVLHGPAQSPAGGILGGCHTVVPGNNNGTVLTVPIQVGNHSGAYRLIVELHGGGEATNTTIVD